jgi:multidrug resistance protein, MATE family
LLAAVGMGNIAINMLGVSVFFGFNGALDTLLSQAIGAGDIQKCGVYLNRARLVNTFLFGLVFILFCFSGKILKAVGQDPEVADYAYQYIMSYSFGIFLMG